MTKPIRFNNQVCLDLLSYQKLIEKEKGQKLKDYAFERYSQLKNQLNCLKDFLLWDRSLGKYLQLFRDYEYDLVDSKSLIDELFDENREFIQNLKITREIIQSSTVKSQSSRFSIFFRRHFLPVRFP